MRVVFIGLGYVGLPLAIAAAESGLHVRGLDINPNRVSELNTGKSPIEDIEDDRLRKALNSGEFQASSDFSLVSNSDVVVICVPTPLNKNLEPDLSALTSAVISITPYLERGTLLVSE